MCEISRIKPSPMQSKREFAHFWGGQTRGYAEGRECGNFDLVAERTSKRSAAFCQHRYPSPDRSAYFQGRPVVPFRPLIGGNRTVIGYHGVLAIEFGTRTADSGAVLKSKLGRKSCRRLLSSLPPLPCLALPVALKATWNAALRAQAQALSLPRFWALTQPAPCLPVRPLACCATTQASTAVNKTDTRAHAGRVNTGNRRGGRTLAAVLRFGDGK